MTEWDQARRVDGSSPSGRTPPHSFEAEEYLLSCCLLDAGDTLAKAIAANVTPEAFYHADNQIIFDHLCALFSVGQLVTIEALELSMETDKTLEGVGGLARLMEISMRMPTTAQASYFIEKIKELYLLRELIKFGTGTVEQCFDYSGGLNEFLAGTERAYLSVLHRNQAPAARWKDSVGIAKTQLKDILTRPENAINPDELSWGMADMDRLFQPMTRGESIVIASRPSIGKSSLARRIALHVAQQGVDVQFHSMEVTAGQVAANMANGMSGVSRTRLRRGPSSGEVKAYNAALDELKVLETLHVDDQADPTSLAIVAKARALAARRPLGLVIIDHLGLMADWQSRRYQNLAEVGSEITKALKQTARNLNVVVLVLAQLNRLSVKEKNRRPRKEDLRDCGGIEQNADRVILLHHPDTDPVNNGRVQLETEPVANMPNFYVEMLQDKGRDVGTSEIGVLFERACARFHEISYAKEPANPKTAEDLPFGK
jgi:replicative DNA helicase